MMIEECYILSKHGNQNDVDDMPVYKRRYLLHLLQKEAEAIENAQEAQMRSVRR